MSQQHPLEDLLDLVDKITFKCTVDGVRVTAEGLSAVGMDTEMVIEELIEKIKNKRAIV